VNTIHTAEELPLLNKTIVVTRGKNQAKEFSEFLERFGARVLLYPAVEIVEPQSWNECDSAFYAIANYSGIIFTSANAVEYFFRRAEDQRVMEQVGRCRMFVVGEITKREIEMRGMKPEELPVTFSAEQLANDIVKISTAGERFLFPKGNLAKSDIEAILTSHGRPVDAVTVYCTQEPRYDESRKAMMKTIEEKTDMMTFFSPSSVAHVIRRASQQCIKKVDVAVIGETTAVTARHAGMNVVLVAPHSTAEAFAEAIRQYYST